MIRTESPRHDLEFFRDKSLVEREPLERRFLFAVRLLEVFGLRFANGISNVAIGERKRHFNLAWRCYLEIQANLARGVREYISEGDLFSKTREVIQELRIESRSDGTFFATLRARSYRLLSFPQKVLKYPRPDLATLESIETVRKRAFVLLVQALSSDETPRFSPDNELNITHLYHAAGVFVLKQKAVYLSDLISNWSRRTEENGAREGRLLEAMTAREWALAEKAPLHIRCQGDSFGAFVAWATVDAVGENLEIPLPFSMKERMALLFQRDPLAGVDCGYFTADMRSLYEMKLAGRSSLPLLTSFQIFFFLKQRLPLDDDLVTMIDSRDPAWNISLLKGFEERSWDDVVIGAENAHLRETLRRYKELLQQLAPSQVPLYQSPSCWPFFVLLCNTHYRNNIFFLFGQLVQQRGLSITLEVAYRFCTKNEASLAGQGAEVFLEHYLGALKVIGPTEEAHLLFLDPPIDLRATFHQLPWTVRRCEAYKESMVRLNYPMSRGYLCTLRHYIIHPQLEVLKLLGRVEDLGIERASRQVIEEALSAVHFPLGPVSDRTHRKSAEQMKIINRVYQFTDSQLFFLHLELIRLIAQGKEAEIGRISHFIQQLREFCPSVLKEEVYFLFLHHPEVALDAIDRLRRLRYEWAQRKESLSQFIVPKSHFFQVLGSIEGLAQSLTGGGNSDAAIRFQTSLTRSLAASFFPPWQPLIDTFGIRGITRAKGIEWKDSARVTHLGQLQRVLPGAPIAIYTHWILEPGSFPLLFISFSNLSKNQAQSAFVHLGFRVDEGRDRFYLFLGRLAEIVLRNEADQDLREEISDTVEGWGRAFNGIAPLMTELSPENSEEIPLIFSFLRRVKVLYQTLFLQIVEGIPPSLSLFDPVEVAAMGHVFNADPRGSLLPESLLGLQPEKAPFLPDGETSFISSCRGGFSERSSRLESLHLNLHLAIGDPLPIYYYVETVQDLTREEEHGEEDRSCRYVTLSVQLEAISVPLKYPREVLADQASFQRHFDYHNLLLKAFVYQALQRNRRR